MSNSNETYLHSEDYDPFRNDIYAEAYGYKYITKINNLERRITLAETGRNKFAVINIEAAVGKSVQTDRIIYEHLCDFGIPHLRNFLIVKRFSKDVEECAGTIGKDDLWGTQVLGITTNNWHDWKGKLIELMRYRVIVITHQRYIDLCLDEFTREVFTNNRHTLIIDEAINLPRYFFSEEVYKSIHNALSWSFEDIVIKVCEPLKILIKQFKDTIGSNNEIIRCKPNIDKVVLHTFITTVESNWHNINKKYWNDVRTFLRCLNVIYNNPCLYNNSRISSFDPNHKLWGLNNNIILDANGEIDQVYKQSTSFYVDRQTKFVDHSLSKLHWIQYNSSASNIDKNKEKYFDEICKRITQNRNSNDMTLIVTHKKFENEIVQYLRKNGIVDVGIADNYHGESIAINHFGNLVGKNTNRDFTQCWVVGTPNIHMEDHVLRWLQYSGGNIGNKSLGMQRGKNNYGFKNEVFEQMRLSYLVGEIYQAVKRIQRNPQPKAELFIVTNDKNVVESVAIEMKNIKRIKDPDLDILMEKKNNLTKNIPEQSSKVQLLKKYLLGLEKGSYNKQNIYQALGLNPSNAHRLWKDVEICNLQDIGIIKIAHRVVTKL